VNPAEWHVRSERAQVDDYVLRARLTGPLRPDAGRAGSRAGPLCPDMRRAGGRFPGKGGSLSLCCHVRAHFFLLAGVFTDLPADFGALGGVTRTLNVVALRPVGAGIVKVCAGCFVGRVGLLGGLFAIATCPISCESSQPARQPYPAPRCWDRRRWNVCTRLPTRAGGRAHARR
jgi:hypothetical protein